MSDEKTLIVDGFPRISIEAARRVADAYETHERAQEFALALKEREAYALAVRSTGQHTLGSLLDAAKAIPLRADYHSVTFDFGDAPGVDLRHSFKDDNAYFITSTNACLWSSFLQSLKQLKAPRTAALWYRGGRTVNGVNCAISDISVDGNLVILHTSYVRKSGK